jgi:4-hydroxybenzoate polyprenyltransferase
MKITERLKNIISYLEGADIPFCYYLLIFISSLTLRNFLEIFADDANVSFGLFPEASEMFFAACYAIALSFTHYYVFWIFTFLALAVVFSLIVKVNIVAVLKTLFCLSPVILITPLFDLLITGGRGIEIAYAHPRNIWELFPLPKIVTPGMLVTSLTSVTMAFSYCKIKAGSWIKGLFAAIFLYLLLVILSGLPMIVKATHPLQIIRVLLIGIFIESILILSLADKVRFRAVFNDLRWLRIFHYLSMIAFGILISKHPLVKTIGINLSSFVLTVIAFIVSWAGAIMLNNAEDYEIDVITNSHRPLVNNVFSRTGLIKLSLWLFVAAFIFACGVNFSTAFFTLLVIGNSCLYSLPPLRLKRIPIFSKLFISLTSLVLVMLGYLFAGGEILYFPQVITWYFIIFVTMAMNIIDLKDFAGDMKAGIKTLPVIFGFKKAKTVTGVFVFIAYFTLGMVLLDARLLLAAALLGIIQFILINREPFREKWVLLAHAAGMVVLLSYLNSPLWLK